MTFQRILFVLINYIKFTHVRTLNLESYESRLTLIRLTSERPCQDWGGAPEAPPPAILALEQIFAQKSCFPKGWHQFQLIWPLFGNFFQKLPKKTTKIENPSKMAKYEQNF